MAWNADINTIVNHVVNGTLAEKLCRVCLLPLDEFCHNMYTKVCTETDDYCIAEVLDKVFNLQFSENEQYNVCPDCFARASACYKFYLLTKRSEEILDFYVTEISKNLSALDIPEYLLTQPICITLPLINTESKHLDHDLETLATENYTMKNESVNTNEAYYLSDIDSVMSQIKMPQSTENMYEMTSQIKMEPKTDEDEIIVVLDQNGKPEFFKSQDDNLLKLETKEHKSYELAFFNSELGCKFNKTQKKTRKTRQPLAFKSCSQCPVKYRFTSKLKEHMKLEHNIELYVCKLCSKITEDKTEFSAHLDKHSQSTSQTQNYTCSICGIVVKKRKTMIAHLNKHVDYTNLPSKEGVHICEICGMTMSNEEELKEHYDRKHDKKFTCFYCGRSYKGQLSFESHIKKHEKVMSKRFGCSECPLMFKSELHLERHTSEAHNNTFECRVCSESYINEEALKKHMKGHSKENNKCETCGKGFVDARALMWHQRLHSNERPYPCEICGRSFVSMNRRNQHALCAHTAPTRRCPLCPSLFHLRSMVNTHIKRVHLNGNKRRNRCSKFQNVFWKTAAVPIQELSISVQNDLLDLQTAS